MAYDPEPSAAEEAGKPPNSLPARLQGEVALDPVEAKLNIHVAGVSRCHNEAKLNRLRLFQKERAAGAVGLVLEDLQSNPHRQDVVVAASSSHEAFLLGPAHLLCENAQRVVTLRHNLLST